MSDDLDGLEREILQHFQEIYEATLRRAMGLPPKPLEPEPPVDVARQVLWDMERGLRDIEDKAGFVLVHPEKWPEMRAKLEAKGIPIFEGEPKEEGGPVTRFWVGGQRIEHDWQEPNGTWHHEVHHTGTRLYLHELPDPDKMMTFTPPKEPLWGFGPIPQPPRVEPEPYGKVGYWAARAGIGGRFIL